MQPWKSPVNQREVIRGNEKNDSNATAHICVMWQVIFKITTHHIKASCKWGGGLQSSKASISCDCLSQESLNKILSWCQELVTSCSISGFHLEHQEAKRYPLMETSCMVKKNTTSQYQSPV